MSVGPVGHVESPRDQPLDDEWDAITSDLKPYLHEFAPRSEVRQPSWSHELMERCWR